MIVQWTDPMVLTQILQVLEIYAFIFQMNSNFKIFLKNSVELSGNLFYFEKYIIFRMQCISVLDNATII